ncbi:MAG: peroxide stress protein YaaA [Candidatus Heimdallarchaeota archaeon]
MRTLIVTASSKSKRNENQVFKKPRKTFSDSISEKNREELLGARSSLLKEFGLSEGPDTHLNLKPTDEKEFLPAYSRYKGRTFSKVTEEAWTELRQNDDLDCVILSAYYGLIRFNEPIRNYEIKQVTKLPSGSTIGRFWKNSGAGRWLFDYIENNEIDDVKFVLSTSYSDIIQKETLMNRLKDELNVPSEDQQFKHGGGMKSMTLRGQYINDLLLNKL